jgi:hypothetical protein
MTNIMEIVPAMEVTVVTTISLKKELSLMLNILCFFQAELIKKEGIPVTFNQESSVKINYRIILAGFLGLNKPNRNKFGLRMDLKIGLKQFPTATPRMTDRYTFVLIIENLNSVFIRDTRLDPGKTGYFFPPESLDSR